jgi:hypothetical protein
VNLFQEDFKHAFVNRFTGSDRYIQDYLAHEVLQQRPAGTRKFLLQIAILNRLSGPQTRKKEHQNTYQVFRAKTQNFFSKPLSVEVGNAMFIHFNPYWVPVSIYFQSERIFSFKRSNNGDADPKLEALNWLNSLFC